MSTYSTGLVCLLVLTSTMCMKIATGDSNSSTTDVNETTSQTVTTPNDTLTTSEISESTTTEPSNVTPNSETPSSTLTQKSSQTSPNTVTISGTSPTASPSSSTTANSTVSAVSMSTENTTSDNTTVNSITTQTPNETTAAGSSGAVLTTTTTLTPTTSTAVTSTPAPIGLNPDGLFALLFVVGDNDKYNISCNGNCSYTSIRQDVVDSFSSLEGFIGVREKKESRKRRNTEFSVEVLFESVTMNYMAEDQIKNQTVDGFQQLNNKGSLIIDWEKIKIIAAEFATQCKNICSAINPCKDGYTCTEKACTSNKCADSTCNGRGRCQLNKETLVPYCVCESNNDYEYSGDKCENEEISKAKVIQIVSGVLGAFCALFLLIIIIMCCRRGSSKSSHLYQIGSPGYANDGYSNESELKRM